MKFAICKVPAAPVRIKASHKVEMTNQLLFGDVMKIHKKKHEWVQIQTLHDGYIGWVRENQLAKISEFQANRSIEFIASSPLSVIKIQGNSSHIPMGASLHEFNEGTGMISNTKYEYSGQPVNRTSQLINEDVIKFLTAQWLNAPYLWGGRTILGVDCSGFCQVIFKMLGFDLKRDAWQQADQGKKVKKLEDAKCGDLAFFDDKEEIVHVGILLSSSKIIHASGCVRIDEITKDGIIHSETGTQTHRLKKIRSFW